MSAVPMKPEYGPTLGRLLAPRWHAASRPARAAVVLALGALMLLAVVVALTLEKAHYSHGQGFPFSFSYRGLYRTTPDPGGYVKIDSRSANGALKYSYAVDPLYLPPYAGALSGELPLYAAGYVDELKSRYASFVLRGEGRTRVNTVPAYQVLYTAMLDGQLTYGRNVLLLPEKPGVRLGVKIEMLTSSTASSQIKSPTDVASAGPLLDPLKTFAFG